MIIPKQLREAIEALGKWQRAFKRIEEMPTTAATTSLRQSVERHASFFLQDHYGTLLAVLTAAEGAGASPVRLTFPTMLRKMWNGGEVQAWLDQQGPFYEHPSVPVAWGHPSGHIVWIDPTDEDTQDFTKAGDGKWIALCRCTEEKPK